jgi:dihydroflavonol-4-reductase
VAVAHIRAFEKGRTGESYLLGGHHATWLEVYPKIAALLNVPAPRSATPVWALYAVAYPLLWVSYLTRKKPLITPQLVHLLKKGGVTDPEEALKSRDELGYQSSSIDEMVNDCYWWLRGEGLVGMRREPANPAPRPCNPSRASRAHRIVRVEPVGTCKSPWPGSTDGRP